MAGAGKGISLDFGKVENAVKKIENHAKTYEKDYKKMNETIANLTSKDWQGVEAQAAKKKFEEFMDLFKKMSKFMQDVQNHMNKYKEDMKKLQNTVTGIF